MAKRAHDGPPLTWIRPPGPIADGLRIGLLGGSFDPAHEGHLHVSDTALRALKLDYVWWLVSPGNVLKPVPGALAARLAGARALANGRRVVVSDIETRLGTRYTADTVAALQRRFPHVTFIWLMGSDNLEQFSHWRRWRQIAARVPIAVVRRPGSVLASLRAPLARLTGVSRRLGCAPSLAVLDGRRSWQSSTCLREQALGAAAEAMLNPTL
ncbi:MAG TPA: nicotinate-nucleotide adenylyltransferase [Rhizomicrobium sp.]|jgi:nicotinate-nucleotide adenylyltransferase|nr:nicotinate-nucleotide adenylyltransferase [Rhizomicrobium sp.]